MFRSLARAGVELHRGVLDDLDSLRAGAARADGVIFAANQHISETTDPAARAQVELNAVEAIGSELEKTDKPFGQMSLYLEEPVSRTRAVSRRPSRLGLRVEANSGVR